MKWKSPSITKIYEALGTVADGRVHVDGDSAKVYSSSGNKFYDINYDPKTNAIMSNDNGSYWTEHLGYPAIAFLMKKGIVSYDEELGSLLKGVAWKDINQKFKNNFEKALNFILESKTDLERKKLKEFTERALGEVNDLSLDMLGDKVKPPQGY